MMIAFRHLPRGRLRFIRQCWLAFFLAAGAARAADPGLLLLPCFDDNMVLQRPPVANPEDAFIWGWVDSDFEVSLQVGTNKVTAAQHKPGWLSHEPHNRWNVTYRMLEEQKFELPHGPMRLTVFAGHGKKRDGAWEASTSKVFTNVVVGEVWLLLDPAIGVGPNLPDSPVVAPGRLRTLLLVTPDWQNLDPSKPRPIVAGSWQLLPDLRMLLAGQLPISTYCLDNLRNTQTSDDMGILIAPASTYPILNHHDFEKSMSNDPRLAGPFAAWSRAWERAERDAKTQLAEYEKRRRSDRRSGFVPKDAREPWFGGLGPSIDPGRLSGLDYEIRGVLH